MFKYLIKYILILNCLLLFTAPSTAQGFKAGLLAGVNLSQLDGDTLVGYNKLGYNLGAKVLLNLNRKWSSSIELLLSQKGSRRNKKDRTSRYETLHLSYVEIPLMINFSDWIDPNKTYYKINFSTGVSFSQLFDFKINSTNGIDFIDAEQFKKNTFNFLIGTSFYASAHIGINFRASWSLLKLIENPYSEALKSKSIAIRIIYIL